MKSFARIWKYILRFRAQLITSLVLGFIVSLLNALALIAVFPLLKFLLSGEEGALEKIELPGILNSLEDTLNDFVASNAGWLLQDPVSSLIGILGFLIVIMVLWAVVFFFHGYFSGYVFFHVARDMMDDLHDKVVSLHLKFFHKKGPGQILTRFTNDMESIIVGIKEMFGRLVIEPFNIIWVFIILVTVSPRLTGIYLVLFPVVGLVISYFGKRVKRIQKRALGKRANMLSMLEDVFNGIRIVKIFTMEPYEKERFSHENERLFKQRMKITVADSAVTPITRTLLITSASATLALGGYFIFRNVGGEQLSGTDLIFFYALLLRIVESVRKLSGVNNRIQASIAGADRIFEFMDIENEIREKPTSQELAPISKGINFEDVSFSYEKDVFVLKNINVDVKKGEMVALAGPSGAGKTTFVNLIPRFFDVAEGRITIDGVDIRDVKLDSLRRQIGMVTQETVLFNDTVRRNISYGRRECSAKEVEEAARAANAYDFIMRLPQGFETVIGADGVEVSGGEAQRIAMARAIIKDSPILILDEATSMLDSESERLIREALDRFIKGRTTIVIAHRLSTILNADKIIVMQDGYIKGTGTHKDLLETNAVYKNLYLTQFASVLGTNTEST